ncbi:MAG: glycosyltransferase [Opitutales bacterium]
MPAAADCALVTLQIGQAPYFEPARRHFRRVCARFGWDFHIIDQRKWRWLPVRRAVRRIQFEKFQVFDLLGAYRRVCFLDSDILPTPDLPNLFEAVPQTHFGCVNEEVGPLAWKRAQERERALAKQPTPAWTERYFNSGMMVFSSEHRELVRLERRRLIGGRWAEQTTLNLRAYQHGVPILWLAPAFNFLPVFDHWHHPDQRLQAHLIHYAGSEGKAVYASDLERIDALWRQAEPTAQPARAP